MSKKIRDYLFFLFIFLFIVITTGASLFASGYKLNLNRPIQFNRLLVRTGTLSITSSPKDAYIYLDGKKQSNSSFNPLQRRQVSTPAKIKNILPGKYTLKLVKEGFWPHEKEVYIDSGITNYIENINLFRSDLPTLVYRSEQSKFSLNANAQYMFLNASQEFVDLKLGSLKKIDTKNIDGGTWLKDAPYFFSDGVVYNIFDAGINDLLPELKNLSWKYDKDNDSIYYSDASKSIYKLDKNNKTSTLLLQDVDNLDYKQDGSSLFIITQLENKKYLVEISLTTSDVVQKIELPNSANYRFAATNKNSFLSLYDERNFSLYLIDKIDWRQSFQINDVKDWEYINRDTIIYHNGWEISSLDLKNNSYKILARLSDPIKEILWHDKDNYYIFSTADSLIAGDINTNTLTPLFKTQSIGTIALNSRNDTLYFYGEIGRQHGIYKLLLK